MTQQAEASRPQTPLHDCLRRLLDGPVALDKRALLGTLYAEVTRRETLAYTAGWNDALGSARRASRRDGDA
ncbi:MULTISPECIES: hypothetical protein [unclassified Streptomyces]|uniref:hypothetical protein n=1 Tax=unclassified Streptomyces TaxID=2593676 RepID=UPI0011CD7083|nr:hypothetical protein [Streptomyces sp. ms191]TXS33231.1 hypothetical protein EAO71_03190 [Streptomyces sp. ms191]